MPTAITQSYEAGILIGGTQVPALPGMSGGTAENYIDVPIIGNFWKFNYAAGAQYPTVDVSLVVRDKTTEAFATSFLNYFFTRSSDVAHDTSVISGGITFFDGRDTYVLSGVKADQFSIHCARGEPVGFNCRFCGTTWATGTAPTLTAWDATAPLVFSNTDFTAGIPSGIVWQYGLTFSNNHKPNNALSQGSNGPLAWNAGMMTGAMNVMVRAADGVNMPASGTPITLQVAGATLTRNFTLNNPRFQDPRMRRVDPGEVMRRYSYEMLGGTGNSTPILSIS